MNLTYGRDLILNNIHIYIHMVYEYILFNVYMSRAEEKKFIIIFFLSCNKPLWHSPLRLRSSSRQMIVRMMMMMIWACEYRYFLLDIYIFYIYISNFYCGGISSSMDVYVRERAGIGKKAC